MQRHNLKISKGDIHKLLSDVLNSSGKNIEYLFSTLRSATRIYKEGGHVTMIYKDQSYSLLYDNKRKINDTVEALKDTSPLTDIEEALIYRNISLFGSKTSYQNSLPQKVVKKYKSYIELGVRNFIKALFSNELNLDSSSFSSYKELISFINGYQGEKYRLTPNNIATLKRRKRRVVLPETTELVNFASYIKTRFPNFDSKKFFGEKG